MGFNSRVGRFIVLVVELVAIAIAVVVWCGEELSVVRLFFRGVQL